MWDWERTPYDGILHAELEAWNGTPYELFAQKKQVGVDCVRFCTAILDARLGITTPIDKVPPDAAFHRPGKARKAMRTLIRLYNGRKLDPRESAQAGDLLIVKKERNSGPGHAIMTGPRRMVFYHATSHGIQRVGIEALQLFEARYRPCKENWQQ